MQDISVFMLKNITCKKKKKKKQRAVRALAVSLYVHGAILPGDKMLVCFQ